jgi:hypothetical protein
MYSRSYISEGVRGIQPPERYDGNAFAENRDAPSPIVSETDEASAMPLPPLEHGVAVSEGEDEAVSASAGARRTGSILSSFFGGRTMGFLGSLGLSSIGSEEILIIAVALFLFLSKDGDKECALMLLLLLIVN